MPASNKLFLGTWLLSCLAPIASASSCTGMVGSIASVIVNNVAAQSFCSSKYPLPIQTYTIPQSTSTVTNTTTTTFTAAPVTTTTTVATLTNTTTVATIPTTVSTQTNIYTNTSITTQTQTATTITTVTVTVTTVGNNKRDMPGNPWWGGPASYPGYGDRPSSVSTTATSKSSSVAAATTSTTKPAKITTSSTASASTTTAAACYGNLQECAFSSMFAPGFSLASSICSCIETTRTSTVSLPTTTVTTTTTSTVTTTPTLTASVTAKYTTSVNATASFTATTSATITTIVTINTTTTFTSTVTASSTATVAPTFKGPKCNDVSDPTNTGLGGCSSDCYCDQRQQGSSIGVCDNAQVCGSNCGSDIDCPDGYACAKGGWFAGCPGGTSCVAYTDCSSSYTPGKRMLERALGMAAPKPMRGPRPIGAVNVGPEA